MSEIKVIHRKCGTEMKMGLEGYFRCLECGEKVFLKEEWDARREADSDEV